MRVHYFSSGPRERVLAAILAAGHEVPAVYVTDPARTPRVAATVALAQARGIAVTILRKADLPACGVALAGEVVLSAGFGFIFPPEFLAHPRLCLNVHGTLLPKFRGGRTLNWVIECGERESGVTVHRIDSGVDTGPILLQRAFALDALETGTSLYARTLAFEPAVVVEALDLVARGADVYREQPPTAERWPDRVPGHSALDPSRPLVELVPKILAADPERYPAYFTYAGRRVAVVLRPLDAAAGEQG